MGAINYKSNNYITLGYNIPEKEKEAEEIAIEEKMDQNDIYYNIEYFDYEDAKNIVKKYNFNILDVKIQCGYYQGFYIDFNFDYIYFYNTEEKKEALKETTKLKELLLELLPVGLVSCSPGWCTSYNTKEETQKEIKEAIKELKEEIKNTLIEKNYFKKYNFDGTLKAVI